MYLQMKLRHYDCADCGTPCKSTSPNAVRCPKCAKAWEKARNRQNQRRRYQRLMEARRAGDRGSVARFAAKSSATAEG
jgi:DNA-directed RNA polymerase subunit RPC12/RpoP